MPKNSSEDTSFTRIVNIQIGLSDIVILGNGRVARFPLLRRRFKAHLGVWTRFGYGDGGGHGLLWILLWAFWCIYGGVRYGGDKANKADF